jgi:sigma-B regulation protein RsbU (phosphoserine phosphatase)
VLHAVKRILGVHYNVTGVSSPAEALALANDFAPDLAILDIRMPGMDGFELMQGLRNLQPDVDVIFVTGSMTDPDAHLIRALQQGAFYYIQKPFDRQVLHTLVERCLELRALRLLANRELTKLQVAQRRLLPQAIPAYPGYAIAARHRPFYFATGDYHDFFPLSDGTLAIFLGDGCGHGPSACMLMATMRALLHTHPDIHGDPGNALTRLTQILHHLVPPDLFVTAVYLRLGPEGQIEWSAAGQHPPLRISPAGITPSDDVSPGMPLGIEPDVRYQTGSCKLLPGESLVAFTDGVVEATNPQGRFLGVAGISRSLTNLTKKHVTADALLDGLIDDVKTHLDGGEFEDDFTLVVAERLMWA